MQDYDDVPNQRPRWLAWVIIIGMILIVLGLLNLGLRLTLGTNSDQANAKAVNAVVEANPALAAGKAALDRSDCMRCHGVDRKFVGPGFVQVAARYGSQPDAVDYISRKIREGSVGEWGNVIMPRHPQVTKEHADAMAAWILALQPATQSK